MAHPTIEQSDRIVQLVAQYGEPDRIAIQATESAYGIMWLRWDAGTQAITSSLVDRNLFISPDGERLSWRQLEDDNTRT